MDAKREKTRKFLAGAKKMQQKTNARKPAPDVKQGWASRAENMQPEPNAEKSR